MEREHIYSELLKEAKSLIDDRVDDIANMANLAALLMERLKFHWIGFYRVIEDELQLGPFYGPVACTRIARGKGVCGTAWARAATIIVDDVDQFPGHIACSPHSRSEIVVPCIRNNVVFAVLDIDSAALMDFSDLDKFYLEALVAML